MLSRARVLAMGRRQAARLGLRMARRSLLRRVAMMTSPQLRLLHAPSPSSSSSSSSSVKSQCGRIEVGAARRWMSSSSSSSSADQASKVRHVLPLPIRSQLWFPGEVAPIEVKYEYAKRIADNVDQHGQPDRQVGLFLWNNDSVALPAGGGSASELDHVDTHGVLASVLHIDPVTMARAEQVIEANHAAAAAASTADDATAQRKQQQVPSVKITLMGLHRIERLSASGEKQDGGESSLASRVAVAPVELPEFDAENGRIISFLTVLLNKLSALAAENPDFNRLHKLQKTMAKFRREFADAPSSSSASPTSSGTTKEEVLTAFLDYVAQVCQYSTGSPTEMQYLLLPIPMDQRILSLSGMVRVALASRQDEISARVEQMRLEEEMEEDEEQANAAEEEEEAEAAAATSSAKQSNKKKPAGAKQGDKKSKKRSSRHEQFKKSMQDAMREEQGPSADLIHKYRQRLVGKEVPEHIMSVIEDEFQRLSETDPRHSEYHVISNYLDWLTILPHSTYSNDIFDVQHAREVLDSDHFGLADVKQRILEFIAVSSIKNELTGKILCFVGPPGTGKTSIGQSIAKALGREFFRFSVGGLDDVSEIKGHRRTYVGAMPGKVLQTFRRVKTGNPVIMIDEIDKLSRGGYRGDPAAAMLEVLDPSQNDAFMDNFLDLGYDLSKVLFLCTANTSHTIHPALLDRMELIELSGYVLDEKIQIARKYLIPKAVEEAGLDADDVEITDAALRDMITDYNKELGIRTLQRCIEQIYRKASLKVVTTHQEAEDRAIEEARAAGVDVDSPDFEADVPEFDKPLVRVTPENLSSFVTSRRWGKGEIYQRTPVGVTTGLVTQENVAGSVCFFETVLEYRNGLPPQLESSSKSDESKSQSQSQSQSKSKSESESQSDDQGADEVVVQDSNSTSRDDLHPAFVSTININDELGAPCKLIQTGNVGQTAQESAALALSVARRYLAWMSGRTNHFFDNAVIRFHFPAGGVPKDGPSGGIALTTALLSLALNQPVKQRLAMTGEITLHGKVLRIGGVKQKLMGARAAGMTTIILPEDNRDDWEKIEDHVKEGIEVHFVTDYVQVFQIAFEHLQVNDAAVPSSVPPPFDHGRLLDDDARPLWSNDVVENDSNNNSNNNNNNEEVIVPTLESLPRTKKGGNANDDKPEATTTT